MSPKLQPLEQSSLAERAYNTLKEAILSGSLTPGAHLAEVELAEALGISRTPVREAIFRLRNDGLVDPVPGGGSVVHTLSSDEIRELFIIREALEQVSVRECASRADHADFAVLNRLLGEQRKAKTSGNVERFLDADERFHFEICRLAGLSQTVGLLISLRERMRQAGLGAVAQPNRMKRVLEEHTAILRALESGDGDNAVRAIDKHLTATRVAFEAFRKAADVEASS
jgi:DNA-binding GntR family transcriptional regulator